MLAGKQNFSASETPHQTQPLSVHSTLNKMSGKRMHFCKVIVLGAAGTGKTSIMNVSRKDSE